MYELVSVKKVKHLVKIYKPVSLVSIEQYKRYMTRMVPSLVFPPNFLNLKEKNKMWCVTKSNSPVLHFTQITLQQCHFNDISLKNSNHSVKFWLVYLFGCLFNYEKGVAFAEKSSATSERSHQLLHLQKRRYLFHNSMFQTLLCS